jgi:Matrixin
MGASGSRSVLIPALAMLLVAAVATDVVRRAVRSTARPAATEAAPRAAGDAVTIRAGAVAPSGDAAPPVPTDRLDSVARGMALHRIEIEGAGTYLPAMLAENDSVLHRWADERARQPLRVAVQRDDAVRGFREIFISNVAWAIGRWNGVGLPVWLEQSPDSNGADIVLTWADRLDSNRTGRSDLTWQRRGPIVKVHVTLATHLPDGRPILPAQMVALALHELGHAIGLGHSPVKTDALYPETSATDLTPRDRSTAVLLYALPPGSLK